MNTYLIYGNDYGLIKREIDKITKEITDVVKYDLLESKIDDLLDDASCLSLFGSKKALIGENATFLTGAKDNYINHDLEYLNNYLLDENHENIVIISVVTDKLDERKKIVKTLKQRAKVIHKDVIEQKDLPKFVMREFKDEGYVIDYKDASYFVDFVGKNVDILLSEIKKMIIFKDSEKKITVSDINQISSKSFNDNIFDLSDAIMRKDFKKIFSCYDDLMVIKEEPIKIISLIASQFTLVYQVKLLSKKIITDKEIAGVLKVHPYRVKLALATNYKLDDLKNMLKKLHNLDYNIKSGQELDKKTALENFLLSL